MLTRFYHVPGTHAPVYLLGFAAGNLAGPLLLGRLYDTIGRKPMIAGTYLTASALLAVSGWLFDTGVLNSITQAVCWCVIFFIALAGASSAYLTVSGTFPGRFAPRRSRYSSPSPRSSARSGPSCSGS